MSSISMPGMGTGLDIQGLAKSMAQADLSAKSSQITRDETKIKAETAALGTLEAALESFHSTLDDLSDPETFGTLKVKMAKDDKDFIGVSIDENAKANSYQIAVEQLATKDKWQMMSAETSKTAIFDPADPDETKEVVIRTADMKEGESFSITLAKGDTLEDVMEKINDSEDNPGIDASIISGSSGASLTLTSNESGTESAITSIQVGSEDITADPSKNISEAKDAVFYVDGLKVTSQSNTVEDAIPGVKLTLSKVTEKDQPISIDLSTDTDTMKKSVKSLVESYNGLKDAINKLSKSEVAGQGEDFKRATLAGDSLITGLNAQLREALTSPIDDSVFKTLASIGITTKQNGDLEIDNKKLDKALKNDPSEVVDLFVGKDTALSRLQKTVETYIGTQSSEDDEAEEDSEADSSYKPKKDGLIKERLDGLKDDQRGIEKQWTTVNDRADDLYQRYFNQFNAMDLAVQQMNSSMASLISLM